MISGHTIETILVKAIKIAIKFVILEIQKHGWTRLTFGILGIVVLLAILLLLKKLKADAEAKTVAAAKAETSRLNEDA
jgi:hypothetical protein